MNTLERIQKQALVVANEKIKLQGLKDKFVAEKRKFNNGDLISFIYSGIWKIGKIKFAKYAEEAGKVGIFYTVFIITKNGTESKSDRNHYTIFEKELALHSEAKIASGHKH